jgi:hypothetical protein
MSRFGAGEAAASLGLLCDCLSVPRELEWAASLRRTIVGGELGLPLPVGGRTAGDALPRRSPEAQGYPRVP